MNAADEVDESKFFAGVFTSQRSEEDLAEYVDDIFNSQFFGLNFHWEKVWLTCMSRDCLGTALFSKN